MASHRSRASARRRRESVADAQERGLPTSRQKAAGAAQSAGRSRRASQPAAAADGKVLVSCPQCGAQYRVAEAAMETKLKCGNCQRTFFPKVASGKRRPGSSQATPFLIGGAVLVVVVLIGVVLVNLGETKVEMAPLPEVRERVDTSWNNPRVNELGMWTRAIADGGELILARNSHYESLQRLLGVEPDRPIPSLTGEELATVRGQFMAALQSSDQTLVFREFEAYAGELDSVEMASSETGSATLDCKPRPGTPWHEVMVADAAAGKPYFRGLEARVRVSFRMEDQRAKVTGWEIVHMPRRPAPKGKVYEPHATIAKPVEVVRTIDGEQRTVKESELSELGHLEGTPPEVQKQIDDAVAAMLDLDRELLNRSIDTLQAIGRPAIPRLLNQFYLLHKGGATSEEDRLRLRRVIQALSALTGVRFGFNVADKRGLTAEANAAQRESALKQWYAWWYTRHNRDFTTAIDKEEDESLFLTEAEKAESRARAEAAAAEAAAREPKKD